MPSSIVTFKAYDEILQNIGGKVVHNVFDQNRYGMSILYMSVKHFGLELGYLNWLQERSSGIDFYNRHIVRLTIHHTFNLKNNKS